jgi:hypothetical protein
MLKALKMSALLMFIALLCTILANELLSLRLFWPYDREVFGTGILLALVGVGCITFFMPREWEIISRRHDSEDEPE